MLDFIIPKAFAQAAAPGGTQAFLTTFAPLILIFIIFWFLLIRPQRKKQEAHQKMLTEIERGDKIITNGGLKGLVKRVVDQNTLEVEFSPDFVGKVHRPMIFNVYEKRGSSGGGSSASKIASKPKAKAKPKAKKSK